jgi:peptidoglycan hydrolase CwlO-like protein
MAEGPAAPPGKPATTAVQLRRTRFLGQQYADITKLRELAAQQDRLASKYEQRISRINTRIERLRHQATLLREKSQKVLGGVGEVDQEIKQHQRDIDAATSHRRGSVLTSDITALHYRVRKLQQKVVDLQQKSRSLELRAAQRTQKTAELKVKVDRLVEAAHLASQEATQYRQRADRLQLVTEQDVAASAPAAAPSSEGEPAGAPPADRSDPPASL